jgi:hypothetical protein
MRTNLSLTSLLQRVSLLVLFGWVLGVPTLTSIVPNWPRMVALTALAFAISSVSLWLAVPGSIEAARVCS